MEIWKDYYGYKVSNKGNVVNKHGKQIKGYIQKDRGYEYKVVALRINKQKIHIFLNQLVYRLFYEDYQDNVKVYNIDGNIENCTVENLKISKAYTTPANNTQIEIYNNNVIACCKDFFKKSGYFEARLKGIDVDDSLGNAYLLIWQYLSSYNTKTSFYSFCARYCRIAFATTWKKYKKEISRLCTDYQGRI